VAAALAQGRGDGLYPTNFGRDLGQIAELIEICFATQMDSGGRSAVSEMKVIAHMGPLVWLLALIDRYVAGLGSGFVWRIAGRVVGNVSLYRAGEHPFHGPGWMIANVAVHPDFRRRGIALALMEATIERTRKQHGKWITLEVEADNSGAQALYEHLGFVRHETLTLWEHPAFYAAGSPIGAALWPVRKRRRDDTNAEIDLIFNRARRGAMVWTQPIDKQMVSAGSLDFFEVIANGSLRERWVMEDVDNPGRLAGSLWIEPFGWHNARMTQFIDPAVSSAEAQRSLLAYVLGALHYEGWSLKIEVTDDEVMTGYLRQMGFRRMRALTQMRLDLK
jgi:ribosomal protein S18 acetylase RimI-like enzyme